MSVDGTSVHLASMTSTSSRKSLAAMRSTADSLIKMVYLMRLLLPSCSLVFSITLFLMVTVPLPESNFLSPDSALAELVNLTSFVVTSCAPRLTAVLYVSLA